MSRIGLSFIVLVFAFSFLGAEEVLEDVTGDRIDDKVIWGKNSVIIENGATGKREIIFKVEEGSWISYVDFLNLGNKKSIKVCTQVNCRIFLYSDSKWLKVYEGYNLKELGISLPKVGDIYYQEISFDLFYWNNSNFVKLDIKYDKQNDNLTIDAGSVERISFVISENDILILDASLEGGGGGITLSGYDIKIKVYDSNGYEYFNEKIFEGESIWKRKGSPLIIKGSEINGEPLVVYLVFNNSSSTFSYKYVAFRGVVYTVGK